MLGKNTWMARLDCFEFDSKGNFPLFVCPVIPVSVDISTDLKWYTRCHATSNEERIRKWSYIFGPFLNVNKDRGQVFFITSLDGAKKRVLFRDIFENKFVQFDLLLSLVGRASTRKTQVMKIALVVHCRSFSGLLNKSDENNL